MRYSVITKFSTALLAVFLLTACGEKTDTSMAKDETASATGEIKQPTPKVRTKKPPVDPAKLPGGVMAKAVDFSSAEAVATSLQAIEDEAGAAAAGQVNNAIGYMLVYDLSVQRNKDKLYQKLDGKTPNEILAMAKR